MNKKWKLIEKILSGEKTLESRWYKTRRAPWNRISKGDTIFFKNSGESITAKAEVSKVMQFVLTHADSEKETTERYHQNNSFTYSTPKKIYQEYGTQIGLQKTEFKKSMLNKLNKRYCILIRLEDPRPVSPFNIDKTGYGIATAWICVGDIKSIKIHQ